MLAHKIQEREKECLPTFVNNNSIANNKNAQLCID